MDQKSFISKGLRYSCWVTVSTLSIYILFFILVFTGRSPALLAALGKLDALTVGFGYFFVLVVICQFIFSLFHIYLFEEKKFAVACLMMATVLLLVFWNVAHMALTPTAN